MTDTWDPRAVRQVPARAGAAVLRSAGAGAAGAGHARRRSRLRHRQADARPARSARRRARRSASTGPSSMLAGARGAAQPPGLRFEVGTIEVVRRRPAPRPRRCDLIFSNAALHWVDDHERAASGGSRPRWRRPDSSRFRCRRSTTRSTHRLAEELAAVEPFRSAFGGWRRSQPVLTPDAYARLLYRYGFADPKVRLIVYPHVLGVARRRRRVGEGHDAHRVQAPPARRTCTIGSSTSTAGGSLAAARRRAAVLLPVQADTVLGAAVRLRRTPHECLKERATAF